jgi:hypothetical protein
MNNVFYVIFYLADFTSGNCFEGFTLLKIDDNSKAML